jgi:hypothetical protein
MRRQAQADPGLRNDRFGRPQQLLDELLTKGNTSSDVFADSAHRSGQIEAKLKTAASR